MGEGTVPLKSLISVALKIAGLYAFLSFFWILFSDKLVYFLASDSAQLARFQTLKGWLFVLFTTVLFFILICRALREQRSNVAALNESKQINSTLVACSPVALYGLDLDGLVTSWNPAAENILGWSSQEVIGQPLPSILPENQSEFTKLHGLVTHGQSFSGMEVVRLKKDNSSFFARVSAAPLYDEAGDICGYLAALDDISERKRADNELRKLSLAVEQSPVVVVITDLNADIEYVNPKFTEITGYSLDEVRGRNPRLLQSGEMSAGVYRNLWQTLLSGKDWHGELHNKRKDGSLYWERVTISSLRNEQGEITHYIGVNEDITSQKNYEQRLEHQATHDDLTGLANRMLFKDRLDQAINYSHRSKRIVAVLLLDLDRFKLVNDSLGHSLGDEVLCLVGRRLQELLRETDTVARFGGDEFAVLLTEVAELDDVQAIATKILRAVAVPNFIDGREITLTASIGISVYNQDNYDSITLIRNADIAMYQSKSFGDQATFYSDGMSNQLLETLELEGALRQAQERGEFQLYYQPKVDLKTGRTIGCEALLRWQHPRLGMISPGQFIPLAEDTGLIVSIGTWALKEACRQNVAWQAAGLPPLCVAVNLSARQFRQDNLVAQISDILHDSGLDPALLELELTESMVINDPLGAVQTLSHLKDLGVSLSLDDFGTGYSSLNYLRRFPVDTLKIDQSFIRDITVDSSGASVVTSIIDIAHNLNLTAIAEGVETSEQLDFLRANNCDSVQGYYYSKPLPPDEFAQRLGDDAF